MSWRWPALSPAFTRLWLGQVVSLLGSGLTGFALSVEIYRQTGSAGATGALMACRMFPLIYLSLFAGPLIDRMDRKRLLVATDLGGLLTSALLFVLAAQERPALEPLCAVLLVAGGLESVQALAFRATLPQLVERSQYARVSGMMSMVESLSLVVAPVLAVALLAEVGLRGILMADLGSCAVALTTVLLTPLPARPVETGRRGWIWWSAGVRYILQRAPLRRLQVVFTLSNFTSGLTGGVLLAYLLLRCDGDTEAVAWVSALSAGGGIAGGAVRALLPARGNQVLRILLGLAAAGLVGRVVLPVLGTPLLLGLALGARSLLIGLVNAANDAVWVSEVPVELQGRVFGARRFCAQGLYPLAVLLGGAIGDAPRLAAALGALPWLTGAGSSPQLIVLSVLFAVAGLLECAAPLCLLRPAALPRLEAVVAPVAMRAGAAGQSTRRREA